jgi:hypothetical protein
MAFAAIEQPTTFAERCALARRIRDELEVPLPIFVDGMDDASRALFSDLPSPAFVIDRQGRIADKLPWADAEALQLSLRAVLAKDRADAAMETAWDALKPTAGWTVDERDAFARRFLALGRAGEALLWLDAQSETPPSVPPTLAAVARAAVTRVLALRGAEPAVRAAAMETAQQAAMAAWGGDAARLSAARIELAEVGTGSEPAKPLWQSALDGLDPRAPAATRAWITAKGDLKPALKPALK